MPESTNRSRDPSGEGVPQSVGFGLVPSHVNFSFGGTATISRIMYGINRKIPNMERKTALGGADYLVSGTREKIWFVSVQFFFADGTATDARIFDNPHADLYEE